MILITHDESNLRALEGQVQDDSKNNDITDSDAIFDLNPGLRNFQKSKIFFWHILYF